MNCYLCEPLYPGHSRVSNALRVDELSRKAQAHGSFAPRFIQISSILACTREPWGAPLCASRALQASALVEIRRKYARLPEFQSTVRHKINDLPCAHLGVPNPKSRAWRRLHTGTVPRAGRTFPTWLENCLEVRDGLTHARCHHSRRSSTRITNPGSRYGLVGSIGARSTLCPNFKPFSALRTQSHSCGTPPRTSSSSPVAV